MAKALRIAALLFVLASVAVGAWQKRTLTTQWKRTLDVVIYPINADGREATAAYLATLERPAFLPIVEFARREAQRYGMGLNYPIDLKLGPRVASIPPAMPAGRATLEIMLWSLQLRFWAWRHDAYPGPRPDVRVFALYFDPARTPRLEHSVGLKEGLIGIARVFAAAHMTNEKREQCGHCARNFAYVRRHGQIRPGDRSACRTGWVGGPATDSAVSAADGGDHGRAHRA